MQNLVPQQMFLTKGVGRHRYKLKSFELALREAGVAQLNLVSVSSILPPGCRVISRAKGVKKVRPGEITFCVMARAETDEHSRLVASAVGIAVPKDPRKWGYLSEVHGHGMAHAQAADLAEDLAASMLGTTLGLEVDPDKAWSEKEQVYRSSGLIIRTSNVTQMARGQSDLWTTSVAMAVLILDDRA